MLAVPISFGVAASVAAIAAVWDWRTGRIPNWLTLPPLVIAPLVYGLSLGPRFAIQSAVALLICGLIPYLLFRHNAMGGGDVKLFAALGAITGVSLTTGLEIELASLVAALVLTLGRLAWDGGLLRTLRNALFMVINPLLPAARRHEVRPELMTAVRMGLPIFVATGWCAFPYVADVWAAL